MPDSHKQKYVNLLNSYCDYMTDKSIERERFVKCSNTKNFINVTYKMFKEVIKVVNFQTINNDDYYLIKPTRNGLCFSHMKKEYEKRLLNMRFCLRNNECLLYVKINKLNVTNDIILKNIEKTLLENSYTLDYNNAITINMKDTNLLKEIVDIFIEYDVININDADLSNKKVKTEIKSMYIKQEIDKLIEYTSNNSIEKTLKLLGYNNV